VFNDDTHPSYRLNIERFAPIIQAMKSNFLFYACFHVNPLSHASVSKIDINPMTFYILLEVEGMGVRSWFILFCPIAYSCQFMEKSPTDVKCY
jgi:hypothetical protein